MVLSFFAGIFISFSCLAQFGRNYKPFIVSQTTALSVQQGQSITIEFSHLNVFDLDDFYPNGFSMRLIERNDYTVDGRTVTPDRDFSGTLRVPVIVNDGKDDSNTFEIRITVTEAPNVPPTITGQKSLEILQGESITLELKDLIVSDPDDDYPKGFTLLISPGQNYTVSGNKITPSPSFVGTLTVVVRVNDGEDDSDPFDLKITVKAKNVAPVITGQSALSTPYQTPITIALTHLKVTDPDDNYPDGFTLKVFSGPNYTVSGTTVRPANNFSGELKVDVTVNDGAAESNRFTLTITVSPANVAPVITGQLPLTTNEETSLTIGLNHLKVTDPDNKYPDDFTIQLFSGTNYTLAGTTITPIANFNGTLQVGVRVNDGEVYSNTYNLQVTVTPVNDAPVITGQVQLSMAEDTNLALLLSHLTVTDVDNQYPNGFTLQVLPGEDYVVNNNIITPVKNYFGNLQVGVTVNDGKASSKPYNVNITVTPVSDPPEIINVESLPGTFQLGKGSVSITEKAQVVDDDQDSIVYAEIGFTENNYQQGSDMLIYDNNQSSRIDGVFDPSRGLLFLFGIASPAEYTNAIRSVRYNFVKSEENNLVDSTKTIYLFARDNQGDSEIKTRSLTMISQIMLDIPNTFTPNGDTVNDTWKIQSVNTSDDYADALIRVYNIRGLMVYEGLGLESEWDGSHNGSLLPSDTYYFTINLNVEYTKATYKGIVTILR
jgi:gliding motility-associated-like protein